MGAADGAGVGKVKGFGAFGASVVFDTHHLGDYLARLMDPYVVAHAQVQRLYFVLVVEVGAAHDGAREMYGVEYRRRRQNSRASDAHLDLADLRQLFLWREFEGDRPFRGLRRNAEDPAQGDAVEFYDYAVGVDGMFEAFCLPPVKVGIYLRQGRT